MSKKQSCWCTYWDLIHFGALIFPKMNEMLCAILTKVTLKLKESFREIYGSWTHELFFDVYVSSLMSWNICRKQSIHVPLSFSYKSLDDVLKRTCYRNLFYTSNIRRVWHSNVRCGVYPCDSCSWTLYHTMGRCV